MSTQVQYRPPFKLELTIHYTISQNVTEHHPVLCHELPARLRPLFGAFSFYFLNVLSLLCQMTYLHEELETFLGRRCWHHLQEDDLSFRGNQGWGTENTQ